MQENGQYPGIPTNQGKRVPTVRLCFLFFAYFVNLMKLLNTLARCQRNAQ